VKYKSGEPEVGKRRLEVFLLPASFHIYKMMKRKGSFMN